MPLLAYTRAGDPLVAPLMSDEDWERLRSDRKRDAWMPYGKGLAVPKVSRLGTRFFAHAPGQSHPGAQESDIHLYLKAQCLVGARQAGWEALPEQSGTTPDGRDWRADVLCRRPGKAWAVALESQVQLQSEATYFDRQDHYAASGLRALWLVAHEPALLRQHWARPDKRLPAFVTEIWKDERGRAGAHVRFDGLALPVAEFVAGALTHQLHWYEEGRHAIVRLVLHESQCWHRTCRKSVLIASRGEIAKDVTIPILDLSAMPDYATAFAQAQAALPDLADSPQPFRRGFIVPCPHCRRDIRHGSFDWMIPQAPAATVPIGVTLPEDWISGHPSRLRPHAGWHWGPRERWSGWAAIGGIGTIERHHP